MHRRAGRFVPALGAALVALLVGAGSFALAGGYHDSGQRGHDRGEGHGGDGHGNWHHGGSHDSWQHSEQNRGDHQSSNAGWRHCDQGRYSAWDEEWLEMSIEGDRFEIAGGQLAQQKAASSAVKQFGARLIEDHTKSLQDAIEVATKLGIEVPAEPSPTQQWELRAVS